jgi:tetratricopeptide (TPR) repeat protein
MNKIIIFLFLFNPNILFTQNDPSKNTVDWISVHNITITGIDALYNFKFKDAEEKFDEVIKIAPNDPRGHFFKAMIYHYRYTFLRVRTDFDKFIQLSDNVIETAENVLDKDKNNSNAMFYLGGIYGYRGIVRAQEKQIIRALWDGRKGYSYLEDAIEANLNNHDAEMGLGMFNYFVSRIPSSFRWMIKIMGFGGDRQKGLEELERAAANGIYANNEAKWWLSQFYIAEDEPERAFYFLDQLSKKYTQNPFYVQHHGNILLYWLRRADEAIVVLKKAILIQNSEAERFISASYNSIGDAYRFTNNFAESIQWYKKYLNSKDIDSSSKENAYYRMGLCYELSGDRISAMQNYQNAGKNTDAQERLKMPLSHVDIILVKMSNHFDAGNYQDVINSANELMTISSLNEDQRGEKYFRIGRAYFELGNFDESIEMFDHVLQIKKFKQNWILPNTHYRFGLAYLKVGNNQKAKQEFETALKFNDYTGERRIKFGIESELDKLK